MILTTDDIAQSDFDLVREWLCSGYAAMLARRVKASEAERDRVKALAKSLRIELSLQEPTGK
jgi:hypothetical protein